MLLGCVCVTANAAPASASVRAAGDADRQIELAARAAYPFRAVLRNQVVVDAESGVVTLSGTVREWRQRELAEATVRDIPGVAEVHNEIDVSPEPVQRERADGWIALRIRSLLLLRSKVSSAEVNVAVRDGEVTLAGVAESEEQRSLIEAYARGVAGVKSVANEVRVRSGEVTSTPEPPTAAGGSPGSTAGGGVKPRAGEGGD